MTRLSSVSRLLPALLFLPFLLSAQTPAPPLGDGIGISPAVLESLAPQKRDDNSSISRCKGPFLREEVRGKQSEYQLSAALTIAGPHRQPTVSLKTLERQTLSIVRVYEAYLRTFIPGDAPNQGTYEYRRLEGETWEEEAKPQIRYVDGGPLANTKILLDGIPLATDEDGVVQDPDNRLDLLSRFDALGSRNSKLHIQAQGYGDLILPMMRTMPQRAENDERRLEEDEAGELLLAYGLDFRLSRGKPEQEALRCRAILPKGMVYATTGEAFPLTVEVTNQGATQTSCLIARSFSRTAGLHGKLFYFGAIPPGKTATFTRLITISPQEKSSKAHLEIRFSDSWSIPQQQIRLELPLIHGNL
ncbi:MAG: hypothetical protein ACI4SG_02870 [Oligosphaeraceae bacterium]